MIASQQPILWAINPVTWPRDGRTPDVRALRLLTRRDEGEHRDIQPLFVAPRKTPAEEEALREQTRRYVADAGGSDFAPAELVFAEAADGTQAVARLIDEAVARNASVIAVASHGRSGPLSWWRAHFAETLLSRSPVPVLFLPPHEMPPAEGRRRVLFATDFTEHSHAAFRRLGEAAKNANWSVTLFHDVSLPFPATCDAAGATVAGCLPEHYYTDQRAWAERRARQWQREAQTLGFEVRRQVIVGGPEPVPQLILEYAERNRVQAIALSTSENVLSRWLLGSTAHAVFRANRYPVWVYGPKCR